MKHLINIIILAVLSLIVILTSVFAILQLQRSQSIDESLVSSLTTKLETTLIQQILTKITTPTESAPIDKAR